MKKFMWIAYFLLVFCTFGCENTTAIGSVEPTITPYATYVSTVELESVTLSPHDIATVEAILEEINYTEIESEEDEKRAMEMLSKYSKEQLELLGKYMVPTHSTTVIEYYEEEHPVLEEE